MLKNFDMKSANNNEFVVSALYKSVCVCVGSGNEFDPNKISKQLESLVRDVVSSESEFSYSSDIFNVKNNDLMDVISKFRLLFGDNLVHKAIVEFFNSKLESISEKPVEKK